MKTQITHGVHEHATRALWFIKTNINGQEVTVGFFAEKHKADETYQALQTLSKLPRTYTTTAEFDSVGLELRRKRQPWDKRKDDSIYKGVSFHPVALRWMARLSAGGKVIFLGYFDSEIEAAEAYREGKKKYLEFQ